MADAEQSLGKIYVYLILPMDTLPCIYDMNYFFSQNFKEAEYNIIFTLNYIVIFPVVKYEYPSAMLILKLYLLVMVLCLLSNHCKF